MGAAHGETAPALENAIAGNGRLQLADATLKASITAGDLELPAGGQWVQISKLHGWVLSVFFTSAFCSAMQRFMTTFEKSGLPLLSLSFTWGAER